jgi:two-component system OmpR family response regulator
VDWVLDGQAAMATLAALNYSMVLLDLGLPRTDGMAVLRAIRAASNDVPVLVLTARDTIEDLVAGLDSGADDYLVKPFSMSELQARMRALARRKGSAVGPTLSNGLIELDPVTHEASVGGAAVRLTAREFSLLQALLLRPGAILSRSELENRIYGWNEEVESNAVEFLIHALRKKLGSDSIKNVRGVGWMVSKAP